MLLSFRLQVQKPYGNAVPQKLGVSDCRCFRCTFEGIRGFGTEMLGPGSISAGLHAEMLSSTYYGNLATELQKGTATGLGCKAVAHGQAYRPSQLGR